MRLFGMRLEYKDHLLDIYYSPGRGQDFISPRRPRLRVRKNLTKGTARLEYHQPVGQHGGLEREINISDGDMMDVVLKQLGYKEEIRVDKLRAQYRYKDFNIDFDQVKGLGTFVEIEIIDPGNKKTAIRKIRQLAEDLGLRDEIDYNQRYFTMLLAKRSKKA
jgi:adenylate cyclase class 2